MQNPPMVPTAVHPITIPKNSILFYFEFITTDTSQRTLYSNLRQMSGNSKSFRFYIGKSHEK